jgi:hypothetical protein
MDCLPAPKQTTTLKDLDVLKSIVNDIHKLYDEIIRLEADTAYVVGEMKQAYIRVVKDKVWRTNRLLWTYQMECLGRFGDYAGSTMPNLPIHLDPMVGNPDNSKDAQAVPRAYIDELRTDRLLRHPLARE